MNQELIIVATVLRPHGRKGEVRLQLETDHPDTLLNSSRVYLGEEPGDPVSVEAVRMHKGTPLLKLSGIDRVPI